MHIVMGERIAGKQDRPSLIIKHPLRAPQIAQNIHGYSSTSCAVRVTKNRSKVKVTENTITTI